MRWSRLFAVLLMAFIIACRKPDAWESMPTHTGENTMGCFVNGKQINFTGESSNGFYSDGVFFYPPAGDGVIHLGGKAGGMFSKRREIDIYIHTDSLQQGDIFVGLDTAYSLTSYRESQLTYEVSPNQPYNRLVFTTVNDTVVAGVFQFIGTTGDGESAVVSQGRFDIKR